MNGVNVRSALRLAQMVAVKQGIGKGNARPDDLILFKQLSANENQYEFFLEDTQAKKELSIAKGLKDRDSFLAIGMSIGYLPVPLIGGVEYPTAETVLYWPDPQKFNGAATNVLTEAQALGSIPWGNTILRTNEGVRIDMPNLRFRTVLDTQFSGTTQNMITGQEIKPIGAAVRFGGGDENRIIVTIKSLDKTDIGGTAARNNYLMIRLVGAVIKGSTNKAFLG